MNDRQTNPKKIGIITFHRAVNYGAMLQCFALKESIRKLGYNTVEVIDYRNDCIEHSYKISFDFNIHSIFNSWMNLKRFVVKLIYILPLQKRLNNFRKFEKNYLSPIKESYDRFDIIVFGSDQIWNTGITNNDDIYFGKLETDDVCKVSYAASLGHGDIIRFRSKVNLLSQFTKIGVRELSMIPILSEMGLNANICLDPTLLLSGTEWLKLLNLKKGRKGKKDFLLVYCIRDKVRTVKAATNIATHMGLKLIILEANNTITPKSIFKYSTCYGPRKFVELFSEAAYVITDSFHGTAFSLLFNKPFVSCKMDDGKDGRADSLLSQLNLKSQFIKPEEIKPSSFEHIDFATSNFNLKELRKFSIDWLKDTIV